MGRFIPDTDKSIEQLRTEIDQTILLYAWSGTQECPVCACETELSFEDPRTVRVDCDLCDQVLQAFVAEYLR